MKRSSTQRSPQARNAKRTAIPQNEEEADSLIASIIEGRQDESNLQEGQAA